MLTVADSTGADTGIRLLPEGFESLEPWAAGWIHERQHDRREKRATSSMTELRAYYDAVGPLVPAIARHLDAFPNATDLPVPQRRLFRLGQMYMEVAWAIEFINEPEESGQVPRDRWQIVDTRGQ